MTTPATFAPDDVVTEEQALLTAEEASDALAEVLASSPHNLTPDREAGRQRRHVVRVEGGPRDDGLEPQRAQLPGADGVGGRAMTAERGDEPPPVADDLRHRELGAAFLHRRLTPEEEAELVAASPYARLAEMYRLLAEQAADGSAPPPSAARRPRPRRRARPAASPAHGHAPARGRGEEESR